MNNPQVNTAADGADTPTSSEVLANVSDADLELNEQTVVLRSGEQLMLREMTLRQRDRLGKIISGLGDENLQKALAPLSNTEGEDVNIDAVSFIQVIAGKIGEGSLTEVLCAAIDSKENRHHWNDSNVEDWVLDTISISDELIILKAFVAVNDVAAYVGNLLALTPLKNLQKA